MKRIGFTHLACTAALSVLLAGAAFATPSINGASIETRTFNDCPLSTVTTSNNYPASIEITDAMDPLCVGFANLHSFSFSADGGATAAVFNNHSNYRFGADVTISGAGEGEGGLRLSPWYGKFVDGRVMANATSGEIACFGGALPFYSFTVAHGITYTKGTTIRFEVAYRSNDLVSGNPATIQYRAIYNGYTYDSPVLPFGEQNPNECNTPQHNGQWGMMNDGRVGGYFQARANSAAALTMNWANITFECLPADDTPVANGASIELRTFNDCPLSTLSSSNNYPAEIQISDEMSPLCVGFANLHSFSISEDGGGSAAAFHNNSQFRLSADFRIDGAGEGEGGLRVSPWYGKFVDGRMMANATSGEIACFGGALPFYTFTGAHGITYVKGTTIRLEVTYRGNENVVSSPGTIQYRAIYNGNTYDSPVLPFGEQNPNECNSPQYNGLWGMMNDGRIGGYFQPRANSGEELSATWSNIEYSTCVAEVALTLNPSTLNLNSNGQYVTATLEPAAPLSPADIQVSSLLLNGSVAVAAGAPTSIGDADGDGNPDLTVKFPRADVAALLSPGNSVAVTVSGNVGCECFEATAVIKVKSKSLLAPTASVLAPGSQVDIEWEQDNAYNKADLIASYDNGQTWSIEVRNINNNGRYRWTVPGLYAAQARVAVVKLAPIATNTDVVTEAEFGESGYALHSTTGVGDEDIAFALRAVQPNPAKGIFNVSFSLPNNKPAKLAVYDVGGREVASRNVVGTAGRHSMTFGTRERMRPGVYMVTITHENRKLSRRVVVIE